MTRWQTGLLLVAMVGIGLLLRLPGLDVSLWSDELLSVAAAAQPLRDLFGSMFRDPNMGFYFLLLHVWIHLGVGVPTIRLLSVVGGLGGIPVTFFLGRRLWGTGVGLCAAWLLTINPFHIYYSQQVRSYAWMVLLLGINTLCFVAVLQQPTRRSWLAYAATAWLAILTHLFAVLTVLGHAVTLAQPSAASVRRGFARVALGLLVVTVPLAACWLGHNLSNADWIPATTWETVPDFLADLCGGPVMAGVSTLLLVLTCRGAGLSDRRVAIWGAVPPLAILAVSLLHPFFGSRYAIGALVPLLLLLAAAICRLPRRMGMLILVGLSAGNLLTPRWDISPEGWREAVHWIAATARPGDRMIGCPRSTIFFYALSARLERAHGDVEKLVPTSETALVQGLQPVPVAWPDAPAGWKTLPSCPSLYLVVHWESPLPEVLRDTLNQHYSMQARASFGPRLEVLRYQLVTAPADDRKDQE